MFIGTKNRPITDARFVPPPPGDQLIHLLGDWLDWINDETLHDSLQILVRVALAHYQVETIHPYTDGNGRLGRLVAVLQILMDGALKAPVLSISDWLKDRGPEYRDHLLRVSLTGEWAPWVDFFAQAVTASADDAHPRVMGLLALREELSAQARQASHEDGSPSRLWTTSSRSPFSPSWPLSPDTGSQTRPIEMR